VEKKEFVFILTHSYDAIERSAGVLQLAANMAAIDAKIDFFPYERRSTPGTKRFCRDYEMAKEFSPFCYADEKPD